ncbi:MAG: hypothetical protein R3B92_00665 [Patescibacteria group bacterium]|uniref:Uncharacterized protein n=1 Tax=candidate division WWE3 bacterium TaxID=2053526 RepID=A0A955EBM2_UNCKA|nr:hypothetical protein [candidate division WWE3 bacterium]
MSKKKKDFHKKFAKQHKVTVSEVVDEQGNVSYVALNAKQQPNKWKKFKKNWKQKEIGKKLFFGLIAIALIVTTVLPLILYS